VIATVPFRPLAYGVANGFGLPDARIVAVDHPLGGIDEGAVQARAEHAADEILAMIATEA
jgi:hypothetical protein